MKLVSSLVLRQKRIRSFKALARQTLTDESESRTTKGADDACQQKCIS
jgi:hypothetical protein